MHRLDTVRQRPGLPARGPGRRRCRRWTGCWSDSKLELSPETRFTRGGSTGARTRAPNYVCRKIHQHTRPLPGRARSLWLVPVFSRTKGAREGGRGMSPPPVTREKSRKTAPISASKRKRMQLSLKNLSKLLRFKFKKQSRAARGAEQQGAFLPLTKERRGGSI